MFMVDVTPIVQVSGYIMSSLDITAPHIIKDFDFSSMQDVII